MFLLRTKAAQILMVVAYLAATFLGAVHQREHAAGSSCCAGLCDSGASSKRLCASGTRHRHEHAHRHGCGDGCHKYELARCCSAPLPEGTPDSTPPSHHHDDCSICRAVGQLSLPIALVALPASNESVEVVSDDSPLLVAAPLARTLHSRAPPLAS